MPGARIFKMVVIMLIEPTIDEIPKICKARIDISTAIDGFCTDSGGYIVQPPAIAPPGTKIEAINRIAAGIINQKLMLFSLGKAKSEVPIMSGIIQLAKPTNAGIIAPKIMIKPCSVVKRLKFSGSMNCKPG